MMRKTVAPYQNAFSNMKSLNRFISIILVYFAFATAVSCKRSVGAPYQIVTTFPKDTVLTGSRILAMNPRIGLIDISTVGNCILCTEKGVKYFFTLYDNSFNPLIQFGIKGRADNEYLAPLCEGGVSIGKDSIYISIFDRAESILKGVIIDKKSKTASVISNYASKNDKTMDLRTLFMARDGSFFGISDKNDCKFFSCDSSFNNIEFENTIFPFGKEERVHEISQNESAAKPDMTKIAIAYYNFPQLEIREADGTIVKVIFIGKILKPQDVNKDNPTSYFEKIVTDEKNIYALFDDPDDKTYSSILAFGWNGEPKARYRVLKSTSFTILGNNIITINDDQTGAICSSYTFQKP